MLLHLALMALRPVLQPTDAPQQAPRGCAQIQPSLLKAWIDPIDALFAQRVQMFLQSRKLCRYSCGAGPQAIIAYLDRRKSGACAQIACNVMRAK